MTRLRPTEKSRPLRLKRISHPGENPVSDHLPKSAAIPKNSNLLADLLSSIVSIAESETVTSLGERALQVLSRHFGGGVLLLQDAAQWRRFRQDANNGALVIDAIPRENQELLVPSAGQFPLSSLSPELQLLLTGPTPGFAGESATLIASLTNLQFATYFITSTQPAREQLSQLQFLLRAVHARSVAIEQLDEARRETTTDDLTGIANRRYFVRRLSEEIDRAGRHDRQLALIMVDLDNLKQLNDYLGHQGGDDALREISIRLKQSIRRIDVVCRYAGDEFCIIMPDAGVETCQALLRRLHLALNLSPSTPDCPTSTISMGGAVFPLHASEPDQLLRAADLALRKAKQKRGTFVLADFPASQ